ncbi:XRE family transcriptional regulator [Streptococcus sp. sy004]|uniref:XRE family transcriptional regulator n=1 Tax=Streptococcus sp. sy004 TaxID=2600149 RepID=UPI0011B36A04|nr:XRE family transcriptional regulator [Streptococcus sp. sy004]TWT12046.1 XRE family transcriptional regulator [Streptococcus sp. sy004]
MDKTEFEKLLDNSGIKRQVIAQKMGLTRTGFYRKQSKPKERFDGNEMLVLAGILGVEPKVVFEAILVS